MTSARWPPRRCEHSSTSPASHHASQHIHPRTPRARKQDGDGAPHRPRPRVTPPRLLLRHAVRRMAWHTGWKGRAGEVMLGPGPGVGGAQGQPVRRHHRGRGHNTHIRHGYLPSSSTGHRTHPAPTPYAPTPVESTPVTPARWPPRGRERMQRITCTTHPQPSAHHPRTPRAQKNETGTVHPHRPRPAGHPVMPTPRPCNKGRPGHQICSR
jgi:hypothetical protein